MPASNRKLARLYLDEDLQRDRVDITEQAAHYLSHVLRLKQGDEIVVFNGRGDERLAKIKSLARKRAELSLLAMLEPMAEPELELVLIQALIKSEAMDLVVQKAAELGVRSLIAVKTDFSVIKLDEQRVPRRLAHWRKVAHGACEQSGRHSPPDIRIAASLGDAFVDLPGDSLRIVFHPNSAQALGELRASAGSVAVLIGPEGGFSEADLAAIDAAGFQRVGLGPRILRADTAAIAAASMAQLLWGDTGRRAR